MKKLIIVLAFLLLLTACGKGEQETNPTGAKSSSDTTVVESETKDSDGVDENLTTEEAKSEEETANESEETANDLEAVSEEVKEEANEPVIEKHINYVVYTDSETNKLGYKKDGQAVGEAIYSQASEFIDGYAVVVEGNLLDDGAYVIDTDMNKVLANDLGIYNYGQGYFGLIKEFQVYADYMNRVRLVDFTGKDLLGRDVFEVDIYSKDLILVADHIKGWLVDGQGKRVSSSVFDQSVFKDYSYAQVEGENFVLFRSQMNQEEYKVIDAAGAVIEDTYTGDKEHVIDLGDGISVDQYVAFEGRFTNVKLPQFTKNGDASIYANANDWFKTVYDAQTYRASAMDEVYDTYEISYDVSRIGNVAEVSLGYYWYGFGAAHPNYSSETYHIDLTTGSAYEISDMMNTQHIYIVLRDKVRAMAKEDDEVYFDVDEIMVTSNTQFRVDKEKLTLYYVPYEIASYAAGIREFEIELRSLSEFIDYNSTFYEQLMVE